MSTKNPPEHQPANPALPTARVRARRGWRLFWLVPLFALGITAWLIYREYAEFGHEITIQFNDVSGLAPGKSPLKFRGLQVGLVERITLSEQRDSTLVTATLNGEYADLAKAGTEFWIVRPHFSGTEVKGLGTITSQNYLEVQLGKSTERCDHFVGREQPPVAEETAETPRGLRLCLLAARRSGLQAGSRVYYRGVEVGSVLAYELTKDGSAVAFQVLIRPAFAPLVHVNSKFWNVAGLDINAGLFSGVDIRLQDLKTLIAGGIEFATPAEPAPPASPDYVFRLFPQAQKEWKQWRPAPPTGGDKPAASSPTAASNAWQRFQQIERD